MTLHSRFDTLELATSSAHMRERIESCLSAQAGSAVCVTDLFVPRVMPRKSGVVLIQYHIRYGGADNKSGDQVCYGEWYPDGSVIPELAPDLRTGVRDFDDLGLRFWLFPRDPKLRHIESLTDPAQFTVAYGDALTASGITPPNGEQQSEILGYRLGRRLVMRLTWREASMPDDSVPMQLVAKMCRPKQALAIWTRHRQLEHECLALGAGHNVFLPRQVLIEKRSGTVFQTAEPGVSLHDMINESSFIDGCREALGVLATLRRFRITGLSRYETADEIDHLNWLIHETCAAFPDTTRELSALMSDLCVNAPRESVDPMVCHRDFYDKQVLYDGNRVVLIDYDTLAASDPALDLGNFIAHLQWRAYQEPSAAGNLADAESAVWDVISSRDRKLSERVRWWCASARLRLACIYMWRPRWREESATFINDLLRHRPNRVETS